VPAVTAPKGLAGVCGEIAFLLLLPPVLYFAYAAAPINQANFIDPYVYTGYIYNFSDLIDRFGHTYYSVRVGLILPGMALVRIFGPEPGYFALALALYLVAGVPLYLAIRKHFGLACACIGYVTLVSSVWMATTLLSQYVASAAVAYLIGATALILLDPERRAPAYFLAGSLFGLALHSQVFTVVYVALAVIPYLVVNVRTLRARIVSDALWTAAGLATVTLGMVAFYWWATGAWNLLEPTLRTVGAAGQIVTAFPPRPLEWFASAPWLLYPLLVVIAAGLLSLCRPGAGGRVLLASWLYAAACCLFLAGWSRIGQGLANHFAFSLLAGSVMPAACVVPAAIVTTARLSLLQRVVAAVLIAAAPVAWRMAEPIARAADRAAVVVVVAAAVLVVVGLSPRHRSVALAACALFAAMSHLLFVAGAGRPADGWRPGPGYWRAFGVADRFEWETYQLALRLMATMPRLTDDGQVLRFWYPGGSLTRGAPLKFDAIQSTYLWAYSRLQGHELLRGAPEIGPGERAILAGSPFRLAVLGETATQLRDAREALGREGVRSSTGEERRLCAGSRCLLVQLIDVRPSTMSWMSDSPDAARRIVFVADATVLEQTLERNFYGMWGKGTALQRTDGRLVYTPTSPGDHLTTKFFDVGQPPEGSDRGVTLTIRMPDAPVGQCTLVLQTSTFDEVGRVPCRAPAGRAFVLPAGTVAFRVLLVSRDQRRADLPAELRIELVERRRPPA
jgi:hypothetical protein